MLSNLSECHCFMNSCLLTETMGMNRRGIPVIDHTYCATAANDTFNEETLLGKSGPQEKAS